MWVTLAMCFSIKGVGPGIPSVDHASEMTSYYLPISPVIFTADLPNEINKQDCWSQACSKLGLTDR